MPTAAPTYDRPQRWDAAFDPGMTDSDVSRLMSIAPFFGMRAENFPVRLSLRDILKHDTRIRRYRRGEIVVREGDHGTSAFLVISGSVRAVLGPELPPSLLGRREPTRKGFFRVIAQLWTRPDEPESFKPWQLKQDDTGLSTGPLPRPAQPRTFGGLFEEGGKPER